MALADGQARPGQTHSTPSSSAAPGTPTGRPSSPVSDGSSSEADSEPDEMAHESVSFSVVWRGSEQYALRVPKYATVLSVKLLLEELTEVDAGSQKLLGLVRGKLPGDTDTLQGLGVQDGARVRLVGTRVADRVRSQDLWQQEDAYGPAIADDEGDGEPPAKVRRETLAKSYRKKLDKVLREADVRVINPPRPGRKLLVLDLDYTLIDCKQKSGDIVDMARPGLHEFLAGVYPYYDLIIWSQTRWQVLELKITLMGMLTHPGYRITSALDVSTMFSVRSQKSGREYSHHVKALEVIWARFPEQYTRANTVHVDDLERNFALNEQNGLRIRPYKRAAERARRDTELKRLTRYLVLIAGLPSFEHLDHSNWKSYH
ncbi:hypothetical protein LPJ63_003117 [Coemansia sp. RSA 2711]|nr:hypothetical protein LPJ63_003117 [Coemansia sp. RSA 2711]KAJ1840924.1 hypothetical protein LPJ70_004431 [Coemansia sp. RSA 2708]KAJ2364965.1 hypothetical protein H4S01_003503 [Coemansia sp. RSA 2610]KAJ2384510.1 hypothetical protein H4S02_004777 [Coemansia sp. RSA 2611]